MDIDPLSPVAPARIKFLLLPVGRIRRERFDSFVKRLTVENVVRLADVSPDGRPNRTMFSPLAFPTGSILINFSAGSAHSTVDQNSFFEPFRDPLVVIGISDNAELEIDETGINGSISTGDDAAASRLSDLRSLMDNARAQFPRALVYQLLLFDHATSRTAESLGDGVVAVPPKSSSTTTAMKTIICDVVSLFLAELNTYAKYLQGLDSIESPRMSSSPENNGAGTRAGPSHGISKRYSQMPSPGPAPRPSSSAEDSKALHRMSMPVQLPSSNSDQSVQTLRGPNHMQEDVRNPHQPPTTFDEISGAPKSFPMPQQIFNEQLEKPKLNGREHSRDRVSVSGFGSGSQRERARNKGKGRIGVVIGSLYLFAGRWPDSLRELSESASIAKENFDHLWHAKALENILVCMLLMSWAKMEYEVPGICYVSSEKPLTSVSRNNTNDHVASTQELQEILPDMANTILHLYMRTLSRQENPPRLPYFESVIRFCKMLATIHVRDSMLDEIALTSIVFGKPMGGRLLQPSSLRFGIRPSRAEITSILLRAYPSPTDGLSIGDQISVLAGIASVFSSIGYHRKKAVVLRELVLAVISGLFHARKSGAAEMGVHPAAGLAAWKPENFEQSIFAQKSTDSENGETGLGDLVISLAHLYGIVLPELHKPVSSQDEVPGIGRYRDTEVFSRISREAKVDSFGNQTIKSSVLKTSINLCEALPDFHGVLYFTSSLLRSNTIRSRLLIPRDDQLLLASNINRTISVANRLGLGQIEAEYWDDFLCVAIEIVESPADQRLIPHVQSDLSSTALEKETKKGPFFYNPFLKKQSTILKSQLVVGEPAEFLLSLQNPYDLELFIDEIRLEVEGRAFDPQSAATVIPPRSIHMLPIKGVPREVGDLTITGAIVTVRGCRSRRFSILNPHWLPPSEAKVKSFGLEFLQKTPDRPVSTVTTKSQSGSNASALPASVFSCTAVTAQPSLTLESTTLKQSAVMILEGETQSFSVTVRNISESVPIDFVLFSFKDSRDGPLQTAMSSKDITSPELYELELLYGHKPAFQWLRPEKEIYIAPGDCETFEIQIMGIPGFTSGIVQIDYGYLNIQNSDKKREFFTRQIQLPVNVTVNASVEVVRADCIALTPHEDSSNSLVSNSSGNELDSNPTLIPPDSFVLILDLRNVWPQPLSITLTSSNDGSETTTGRVHAKEIHDVIQPGHSSRIMISMNLISISNPYLPIPSLNPARTVPSDLNRTISDAELATRELFWYREELLKRISGTWKAEEFGRSGQIEMRSIRLSHRMVDAVRSEDVEIETMLLHSNKNNDQDASLDESGDRGLTQVKVENFLTVKTRITNRTKFNLSLIIRLQPSLKNQPHATALDLPRRLAWSGLTQQIVPLLEPGTSIVVEAGICALCRGEYEIGAMAEEIQVLDPPKATDEPKKGGTERRRKIWYARRPCVFVATDREAL